MIRIKQHYLILGAVAIVAGGAWYVWQQSSDEITTLGLKTYHNDQFGFEFKYPNLYDATLVNVGSETRRSTTQLDEIYIQGFDKSRGQLWVVTLNIRESKLKDIAALHYNYQEWMPGNAVQILDRGYTLVGGKDSVIESLYNERNYDSPEIWVHTLNDQKVYTFIFAVTTTTPKAVMELGQVKNSILSSFKFTK